MAVPQHLDEAVIKLKAAAYRIDQVREQPFTPESQREWLGALTDLSLALADIQEYNNESVHEKLHELASRIGLKEFPSSVRSREDR